MVGPRVRKEITMQDVTSKAAQEALASGRRYYTLSYDIPKVMSDLAEAIRKRIRSYALAVHESGYLVPEENVAKIKDIITASAVDINANREKKGKSTVAVPKIRLIKADADQLPEILDWYKERSETMLAELRDSFATRLAGVLPTVEKLIADSKVDVNDKAKEIVSRKRAILRDLKKRAEDADAAFFWFAATGDTRSAVKGVLSLIDAERKALNEVKQLGETVLSQGALPGH
jgi:CHASE3 domain sensor protein